MCQRGLQVSSTEAVLLLNIVMQYILHSIRLISIACYFKGNLSFLGLYCLAYILENHHASTVLPCVPYRAPYMDGTAMRTLILTIRTCFKVHQTCKS